MVVRYISTGPVLIADAKAEIFRYLNKDRCRVARIDDPPGLWERVSSRVARTATIMHAMTGQQRTPIRSISWSAVLETPSCRLEVASK